MPPELAQWIVPLIVIFGTLSPAVIVGVMLYLHRSLRQQIESRMERMETRLREDLRQLRNDTRGDMERLDERVARLEHGQAKLEGLLEGLREAITRRNVA